MDVTNFVSDRLVTFNAEVGEAKDAEENGECNCETATSDEFVSSKRSAF